MKKRNTTQATTRVSHKGICAGVRTRVVCISLLIMTRKARFRRKLGVAQNAREPYARTAETMRTATTKYRANPARMARAPAQG